MNTIPIRSRSILLSCRTCWILLLAGCGAPVFQSGDTVRPVVVVADVIAPGDPLSLAVTLVLERPGAQPRFLGTPEVPRRAEVSTEVQYLADGRPLGDPVRPRAVRDCCNAMRFMASAEAPPAPSGATAAKVTASVRLPVEGVTTPVAETTVAIKLPATAAP